MGGAEEVQNPSPARVEEAPSEGRAHTIKKGLPAGARSYNSGVPSSLLPHRTQGFTEVQLRWKQ